jgi:hypothetical protein
MARARPRPGSSAASASVVPAIQNRLFTVMRGTESNAYGDETDVGIPYLTDVPGGLAETGNETFDRASSTRRTIRTVTCVFQAWVDVTIDDTLMDQFTGYYYQIESMEERPGIGYYPPQKILTLRMRSGVSVKSDG